MRIKLALRKEPIIAAKAKAKQAEYHGNQYDSGLTDKCRKVQTENKSSQSKPQTPQEKKKTERQNSTNHKLAEIAGVSDKTVERYKKIQQSAPEEVKAAVKSGEEIAQSAQVPALPTIDKN